MNKIIRMGDALDTYLKQSGLGVLLKNQEVCRAWAKVVGPEMASHSRIVAFRRGALVVEVASSSLYAELSTFYLPSLVESIQQEMKNKKVRSVKLRLGQFLGETQDDHKGENRDER